MFERTRTGAVNIVGGSDPINLQNVKQVVAVLEECLVSGQPRIVLDLEKVPLLDSSGLEMLLDYQDRCRERGGVMKLAAPSQLCQDILMVTDVGKRFEMFPDKLAAIGSFVQ